LAKGWGDDAFFITGAELMIDRRHCGGIAG